MNIVAAQIEVTPAQPLINAKRIIAAVNDIVADQGDVALIAFPELTIPGYLLGDLWEEQSFLRECKHAEQLVRQHAISTGIYIAFGNVSTGESTHFDGRVSKYNSIIVATPANHDDDYIGYLTDSYGDRFIPKTLLPNYREFDEPRHFSTPFNGDIIRPFEICDFRGESLLIGFSLCEDGWDVDYPIKVTDILAMRGAQLIINHSCSPFTVGKNGKRNRVFGSHAMANSVPIMYVNAIGLQNNGKTVFTFDGCSVMYDSNGEIMYESPMFKPDFFVYDSTDNRVQRCFFERRGHNRQQTDIGDIHGALVYAIKNYCEQSGIKNVVIGSSGGIDSAVSAALHVEALGAEHVFLVNMPSKYNSSTTRGLSADLARNLGTPYATVSISDSVEHTKEQIDGMRFSLMDGTKFRDIALSDFNMENVQARDRSSRILAAISSALEGGVFSNNGNKAETMVGYATLYGDVAGYLAPIADLWKEQVYLLGKYINHINEREVIPSEIFEIVACAELSDNQNVDEGKGDPLIYWYHDRLFKAWVQDWNRKSPEEILEWYHDGTLAQQLDFPKNEFGEYRMIDEIFDTPEKFISDLERWWKLFKGMGVAKRVQAPPVVAVTKRAFGFDYRESLNCCMFTTRYLTLKEKVLS